MIIFNKTLFL